MLWATYAARKDVAEAVDVLHGRRRLASLTAPQWRQLCARVQPLPCTHWIWVTA